MASDIVSVGSKDGEREECQHILWYILDSGGQNSHVILRSGLRI